jgi:sec-independent protein translocase protein TatC
MSGAQLPYPDGPHGADPLETSRAPFMEHLVELRKRFIISIIAILVGVALTWTWVEEIFAFLLVPLQEAAKSPELAQIHHRRLEETFMVLMKTSLFSGVMAVLPVLLWQAWKFVAPGLYPTEKRVALPVIVASTVFFVLGVAFCYKFILPYGYAFLLGFGTEISTPQLMMEEYLGLTTRMLLAFGVVFQLPVVASVLAKIGLINYRMMLHFWRYALVISFIVGAILTPPDVASQVMLAGPMMVLYFISVGCAWVFGKRDQ